MPRKKPLAKYLQKGIYTMTDEQMAVVSQEEVTQSVENQDAPPEVVGE